MSKNKNMNSHIMAAKFDTEAIVSCLNRAAEEEMQAKAEAEAKARKANAKAEAEAKAEASEVMVCSINVNGTFIPNIMHIASSILSKVKTQMVLF